MVKTGYTPLATDADGDTVAFSIVAGADGDKFELDVTNGELKFKQAPDYENPTDTSSPKDNVYEVQIQAYDGNGGTATQTVSVSVTNINEAPSLIEFSKSELFLFNHGMDISAIDPEGDDFTIALDQTNENFQIIDQKIHYIGALPENSAINQFSKSYEVPLLLTDIGGEQRIQSLMIEFKNLVYFDYESRGGTVLGSDISDSIYINTDRNTGTSAVDFYLDIGKGDDIVEINENIYNWVRVDGEAGDKQIIFNSWARLFDIKLSAGNHVIDLSQGGWNGIIELEEDGLADVIYADIDDFNDLQIIGLEPEFDSIIS